MPEEEVEAPATTSLGTSPERGQSPSTTTGPRQSNSVHTPRYNKCFPIKSGEPYVMSNEIKGDGNSTLRHRVKSNRSVGTLPSELAEGDPGSLDPEHCEGILNFTFGYPKQFQGRKPHPSNFNLDQQRPVEQEVKYLCHKGAVTELSTAPIYCFLSTLFLVPKKDGGQRPVINLKNLNSFVEVPHFNGKGFRP